MKNSLKNHAYHGIFAGGMLFFFVFLVDLLIMGKTILYNYLMVFLICLILGFVFGVLVFLFSMKKKMKSVKPYVYIVLFLFMYLLFFLQGPFVKYSLTDNSTESDDIKVYIGKIDGFGNDFAMVGENSPDVDIKIG